MARNIISKNLHLLFSYKFKRSIEAGVFNQAYDLCHHRKKTLVMP